MIVPLRRRPIAKCDRFGVQVTSLYATTETSP
jgi:hypothetical protein